MKGTGGGSFGITVSMMRCWMRMVWGWMIWIGMVRSWGMVGSRVMGEGSRVGGKSKGNRDHHGGNDFTSHGRFYVSL